MAQKSFGKLRKCFYCKYSRTTTKLTRICNEELEEMSSEKPK